MSEPQVSVVICTRNKRARLALTLAGLAAQKECPPFEVIIVDDGSSDGTAEFLWSWWGPFPIEPVRIARDSTNWMQSRPRNIGAAHARGSMLIFLDDDAVPGPHFIAAHASALAEREHQTFSRGAFRCIGATEWLSDPATGEPYDEVDGERVRWDLEPLRSQASRIRRPVITAEKVVNDPSKLTEISQEGLYPGIAARDFERAIHQIIDMNHACTFLAPVPHNIALTTELFHAIGGWDIPDAMPWLDFGVKLQRAKARFRYTTDAVTHHLFHHRFKTEFEKAEGMGEGYRILEQRYPEIAWGFVFVWINTYGESPYEPEHLRFTSLERLARLALGSATPEESRSLQALLAHHPLWHRTLGEDSR